MHNLMQGTEPFMFGIRTPEGDAFMDEFCVDSDRISLENLLSSVLNKEQEEGDNPFEVVPLYTAEQVAEAFAAMLSPAQLSLGDDVFRREDRYTVIRHADLKHLDLSGALKPEDIVVLAGLLLRLRNIRTFLGKPELRCVVVESTLPEYEAVWQALHLRMGDGDSPV